MAELMDYSSPFNPQLSPDKLSREALLKLVKAYGEYIHRLDGTWYMTVKKRQGNDEAFACDRHVWEKKLKAYELKVMQATPGRQSTGGKSTSRTATMPCSPSTTARRCRPWKGKARGGRS